MQVLNRLTVAAYGMHLADQIALVAVPLVAAIVFNAPATIIGVLVAAQSLAHLLGSVPSGLIIDRVNLKSAAITSAIISGMGFSGVALSIVLVNLPLFGFTVMFAGFGIVLFVLVCLSILPRISDSNQLAGANARIEIPRSMTSFAIPLAIGVIFSETSAAWLFVFGALGSFTALAFVSHLPKFSPRQQHRECVSKRLADGARYVVNQALLLPISLCAVFWNLAFSALLVVMVPLLVEVYLLEPGTFGVAMSAFGLAAIAGTWVAGKSSGIIPPNVILLFGPGSSAIAAIALLFIQSGGPAEAIYIAYFLLGFGPSMWLVAQNSVRQLVTPPDMLGRVNAVIQTAIYGVRPAGALLGGAIVSATSPSIGLVFVVTCFTGSFAAALFRSLVSVRRYTDLVSAAPVSANAQTDAP